MSTSNEVASSDPVSSDPASSDLVSFDQEELILVNSDDQEIGTRSKLECHLEQGELHRAFSVFIFNSASEVLLQQRTAHKFLWPLYWSNACCSHPRAGEKSAEATHRRLKQELGISAELAYLYKFEYHASYLNVGSEHELCWVWAGFAEAQDIKPNSNEVADWRFVSREELDQELSQNPDGYTPWMKMEWERILKDHQNVLHR